MNSELMPSPADSYDDWRPARVRSVELSQVRNELLALYQPPLRATKTLSMMKRCFDILTELGVTTSGELDESLVAKIITSRPPNQSCRTVIQALRCLRVVSNFCTRRGYLRQSPFAFRPVGAWVRMTPVERRRFFTSDEVRRILATMREDVASTTGWPQWRARRLLGVTACLAYGGFRTSEAFQLWTEDVNIEDGIILVVPRVRLKTAGSARMVPMPPPLKKILAEEWLPYRQSAPPGFLGETEKSCPFLFPGTRRAGFWNGGPVELRPLTRLKIIAKRAGVDVATFAMFRHSWATQAEHLGIAGASIQRVLGHTTELTSLKNYRHSVAMNLTRTVEGFDY